MTRSTNGKAARREASPRVEKISRHVSEEEVRAMFQVLEDLDGLRKLLQKQNRITSGGES